MNKEPKLYITSNWNLGGTFFVGTNVNQVFHHTNRKLMENFEKTFKDGDTLVHLGNIVAELGTMKQEAFKWIDKIISSHPNSLFIHLIQKHQSHDEYCEVWEDRFELSNLPLIIDKFNIWITPETSYVKHKNKIVVTSTNWNRGEKFGYNFVNVGAELWDNNIVDMDDILKHFNLEQ